MKKTRVAILFGGPSSEHEVSLNSAKNVIKNLDVKKFDIVQVKISKDGVWLIDEPGLELSEEQGIAHLKTAGIDLVFIILHGEYGEDGTLQRKLEEAGIKFTGSGSKASKVAMDKVESAKILEESELNVPPFIFTNFDDWEKGKAEFIKAAFDAFELPMVVKPTDRGSSVGTLIVKTKNDLEPAIRNAFRSSENVMIQKFISGREITCGVIESKEGEVIALMPTEIIPTDKNSFFDYKAKYVPGASVEVTPPNNLSKAKTEEIREASKKSHIAHGCSHISRSDFILTEDDLYILEINTIPGMTETSLIPQGAKALDIDMATLLEIIIEVALK